MIEKKWQKQIFMPKHLYRHGSTRDNYFHNYFWMILTLQNKKGIGCLPFK